MYYKIHETKHGKILAVADDDLLGKHLISGKTKDGVDIFINPRFYGDKKASKEWLIEQMQSNAIISVNLIGKEAVAMGIEAGAIDKESVKKIGKIPHAQGFLIF